MAPPPRDFGPAASEQGAASFSGFARRAPPPGPGPDSRAPGMPQVAPPPLPAATFGSMDSPSRGVRSNGAQPIPPGLSDESPSRRVFKRRHTAGATFAELAQTGFAPPQAPEPNSGFGKVPVGAVATELDMGAPPMAAPPAFAAAPQSAHGFGQALQPAPAGAPFVSEDQLRASMAAAAEPIIRAWLDANLANFLEQRLGAVVQARVSEAMGANLQQAVDQRIHHNVEANLGPYIEDRVGAHVDARLPAAVEEKVMAAVKQQVAAALNLQIAQAVTQHVAAAVSQQLQAQQHNLTRIVDDRVKSEIRGVFQRLAGN
jgi:hypothetical protein